MDPEAIRVHEGLQDQLDKLRDTLTDHTKELAVATRNIELADGTAQAAVARTQKLVDAEKLRQLDDVALRADVQHIKSKVDRIERIMIQVGLAVILGVVGILVAIAGKKIAAELGVTLGTTWWVWARRF